MKKLIGLSVIILMLTVSVNAQQQRQRKGNDFTPEQTATLQAKKMALNLDLTANQQKDVYNLMKKNAVERQKTREDLNIKRGDGKNLTSDQKFERESRRLDNQIANKAAMKNILNKDQYEKWNETMQKRMKTGKKKMAQNKKGMQQKKGASQKGKNSKNKS